MGMDDFVIVVNIGQLVHPSFPSLGVTTCQSLTLSVEYRSGSDLNFTCVPITSCENSTSINSIQWMKSYTLNPQDYAQLTAGDYMPPSGTGLEAEDDRDVISLSSVTYNDSTFDDALLDIMDPTILSVGFYEVYGNPGMILLHSFTIFSELFLSFFYLLVSPIYL